MTFLPIRRSDLACAHQFDRFFNVRAAVQNMPQDKAGTPRGLLWLLAVLDLNLQKIGAQAFFVDAVHADIRQTGEHLRRKAFFIGTAGLKQRVKGIDPHRVAYTDGFVFILRLTMQDHIQTGERRIIFRYAMSQIIIPAGEDVTVLVVRQKAGTACLCRGSFFDFPNQPGIIKISGIIHKVQTALFIQPLDHAITPYQRAHSALISSKSSTRVKKKFFCCSLPMTVTGLS